MTTTRASPRDRQHTRDRDGAVRTLAVRQHGKVQAATGKWQRGESGLPDPLDAIAADLGKVMADTVFAGVEGLSSDHRRFRERFGIGEVK